MVERRYIATRLINRMSIDKSEDVHHEKSKYHDEEIQ